MTKVWLVKRRVLARWILPNLVDDAHFVVAYVAQQLVWVFVAHHATLAWYGCCVTRLGSAPTLDALALAAFLIAHRDLSAVGRGFSGIVIY